MDNEEIGECADCHGHFLFEDMIKSYGEMRCYDCESKLEDAIFEYEESIEDQKYGESYYDEEPEIPFEVIELHNELSGYTKAFLPGLSYHKLQRSKKFSPKGKL